MRIRRNITICILLAVIWTAMCGAFWEKSEVMLDTEKNAVYSSLSIDELVSDVNLGAKAAKTKYNHKYFALPGKYRSISQDKKSIIVAAPDKAGHAVTVTAANEDAAKKMQNLAFNASIIVLGRVDVSMIVGDITVRADAIIDSSDMTVSDSKYYLSDGSCVDSDKLADRELAGGMISYKLPKGWESVEHNITDEELGTIEGYQYRLNEMKGQEATEPESFFVCYFDNMMLKNPGDKDETQGIEEAIIRNILGIDSVSGYPMRRVNTYYGRKYRYYQDAYRDKLGRGYHAEFVFENDGTAGEIVYLYIYKDAKHLGDIMMLMRLLENE